MTGNSMWIILALLGALFAALVQVSSKAAMDSKVFDPATLNLVRAIVMTVAFVGVVAYEMLAGQRQPGGWTLASAGEARVLKVSAIALFSGLAASASWYFGYRALQLADVSKTYPLDKLSVAIGVVLAVLIFRERPSAWNWTGIALMIAGAYLVTLPKAQGVGFSLGNGK